MKEKQHIEQLEKEMRYQKKLEDQAKRRDELDACIRFILRDTKLYKNIEIIFRMN